MKIRHSQARKQGLLHTALILRNAGSANLQFTKKALITVKAVLTRKVSAPCVGKRYWAPPIIDSLLLDMWGICFRQIAVETTILAVNLALLFTIINNKKMPHELFSEYLNDNVSKVMSKLDTWAGWVFKQTCTSLF